MKRKEIILRAYAKKVSWIEAAEVLGMSCRHLRRVREKYEEWGFDGLVVYSDQAMRFTGTRTKIVSLFVLAFLCLNVGGALCLTYCSQILPAKASTPDDSHISEHCRLAKQRAEKEQKDTEKVSVDAHSASCCTMPVSLFAAPVETRNRFSAVFTAAMPVIALEFTAPSLVDLTIPAMPVYRPPPLDRRVERLRNCVIRI